MRIQTNAAVRLARTLQIRRTLIASTMKARGCSEREAERQISQQEINQAAHQGTCFPGATEVAYIGSEAVVLATR
jgi:hypothetical protein